MSDPSRQRRETRSEKGAGHSRLGGGSVNKQGNLPQRLVLGACNTSQSPHSRTGILHVYTEALTGFSHVNRPHGPPATRPTRRARNGSGWRHGGRRDVPRPGGSQAPLPVVRGPRVHQRPRLRVPRQRGARCPRSQATHVQEPWAPGVRGGESAAEIRNIPR